MARYNQQIQPRGSFIIDDEQNAIFLRFDFHRDLDNKKFAFVPKMSEGSIVTHLLQPSYELGSITILSCTQLPRILASPMCMGHFPLLGSFF